MDRDKFYCMQERVVGCSRENAFYGRVGFRSALGCKILKNIFLLPHDESARFAISLTPQTCAIMEIIEGKSALKMRSFQSNCGIGLIVHSEVSF